MDIVNVVSKIYIAVLANSHLLIFDIVFSSKYGDFLSDGLA